MSVIIRLQGLPWSASAMNIRHFFTGLSIPAGGVHIIGGEGGDAFIAFSSDDDARMAMKMNMCPLNGTTVQLFLSSKSEMQSVIDAARSGTATAPAPAASSTANTSTSAASGMGTGTGGHQAPVPNMSGGFNGMQGMGQSNQYGPVGSGFQNMPQRGDMSGSGGMGMGGKGQWQPMPGMSGGANDGDGQFSSNQRNNNMMVGEDNANRYPGYPDNRQHMNMQQGPNVMGSHGQMGQGHMAQGHMAQGHMAQGHMAQGHMAQGHMAQGHMAQGHMAQGHMTQGHMGMGMQGFGDRQHLGMDLSGQGESMGQGAGSFGDDMRSGNMGSSMNQKMGQFGGVDDREKTAGYIPGQMNTGIDSDPMKQGMGGGMIDMPRNRGMSDDMARSGFQGPAEGQGGDLMKERLGNQVMSGPPTSGSPGLGLGGPMRSSWVGDISKEGGSFSDKPPNPDRKGEQGDMAQETSFRRDRPNRVNRFAEVQEHPRQDSFNQPQRSSEADFERDMRFPNRFSDGPKDQVDNVPPGRGFSDRPRIERRGPIGDDGMPSTRYPPDDDQFQEEGRYPMGRGGPNDRRPPPNRYMPDDMRPMDDESRMPQNDRGRFGNDERGLGPNEGGRYPPHGERFPDHDRRFPPDQHFMGSDRAFPPSNDRAYPGDDRRPPPGEGRFMPEDRPDRSGMWQGERQRNDDMMGRRPGDNPFPPDDPRHREREQELRREAFERNRHGPGGEWPPNDPMHGGRMDYHGRQGNEDVGGKPFPPDRRGFSGDRHGGPGFREEERDFYAPPGRVEGRQGPSRWDRTESGHMERSDMGGRGPFPPGNHDGPMGRSDRGPMPNAPPTDNEGPSDMDQRISQGMYGNRRPGMPPNRGDGPMEGEFGEGPHDFDNRAMGPRGRGGGMMMMGDRDRPPRGRGDPFNRGRPGAMARGRGMDMDRHFEEGGPPGQDVDNRKMPGDRFAAGPNQGPPQSDLGPRSGMGKSLLGDGPQEPVPGRETAEMNKESRSDTSRRDNDSRNSRRDSRDRDRRYDDRRGRDRDDRDRYRSRYDRDRGERERDRDKERDRDRRRSRSRSRNRGSSRDRDRYSRDRSSRDNSKSEGDSSRSTSTKKPDERPTRYLHIKNMPLTITYRDLRRFFYPLEIPFDGIKLINDKEGNRNGEAFMYFHRLDDAGTAQRKNGERNGGRVVSIMFTTESEFSKAVDSYVPVPDKKEPATVSNKKEPVSAIPMPPEPSKTNTSNKGRFIVQLNNLPQTITRQDINQFFKTLKIDKEGEAAYIEFDNNGVATGNGFVEFKTDIDYKKALTHSGSLLGTSKITVIPGKAEEADKLKAVQGEMFQRAALRSLNKTSPAQAQKPGLMGARPKAVIDSPQQQAPTPLIPTPTKPASNTPTKEEPGSHDTVCIHIQGLPLLATPRDIKDFFGDSQIALRGINIAHDSQGKPLGEGFVEFKFLSDFEKALKKDKTSMGRHIVAVKPISKKDMLDRMGNSKQQGANPRSLMSSTPPTSLNNQSKPSMPPAQQSPQNTVKPLLAPTSPSSSQPQALPQGQVQGSADNQSSFSNNPQNQSIPRPSGPSHNTETKHQGPPNANPANPRGPAPEMSKTQGPVMPLLQTPQQVLMPGGGKTFPPGVLNNNWYYVRCQNFPPDISIGEIMNFFKTFRPIGDSIRLHYSSEGQPTGNAVVGFASGEEATRALQCLHMRVCRHNVVSLHPA